MIYNLLSVASVFEYIFFLIIAILVLLLMVTIHEFGHYIAGKKLGFKINEFSIGFGKAIYKHTNKKTGEIFAIRIFPLGGYCAFAGEDEDGNGKSDFNNQKPWKRLIVLFSGAFFNFLSAIIFSFILLWSYGYEHVRVTGFTDTSPNQEILEVGDVIYGVNGVKIDFVNDNFFYQMIEQFDETESFSLTVKRDGNMIVLEGLIRENLGTEEKPEYSMGITLNGRYTFLEALAECVPFTIRWCWKILLILWALITGALAISNIGGPITTISMMASYGQANFAYFILLLPVIATNLAVFNLLPFPALDGSRMVFTTIEWIRGKPINRKIEATINAVGLYVLLGFVILVDILHFII